MRRYCKLGADMSALRHTLAMFFFGAALMPLPVFAQAARHRWEIGVVVPVVRFVDFETSLELSRQERPALRRFPLNTWFESGVGVRLGYRFTERIALEAEGNAFSHYIGTPYVTEGLRLRYKTGQGKLQLLVGPVVRQRLGPFVLFAKARPGWIRIMQFDSIVGISRGENAELIASLGHPQTFASFDLGGGAELPIGRRIVGRFDVGDTIVRYRTSPEDLNPRFSRHNLQLAASAAWRF